MGEHLLGGGGGGGRKELHSPSQPQAGPPPPQTCAKALVGIVVWATLLRCSIGMACPTPPGGCRLQRATWRLDLFSISHSQEQPYTPPIKHLSPSPRALLPGCVALLADARTTRRFSGCLAFRMEQATDKTTFRQNLLARGRHSLLLQTGGTFCHISVCHSALINDARRRRSAQ